MHPSAQEQKRLRELYSFSINAVLSLYLESHYGFSSAFGLLSISAISYLLPLSRILLSSTCTARLTMGWRTWAETMGEDKASLAIISKLQTTSGGRISEGSAISSAHSLDS